MPGLLGIISRDNRPIPPDLFESMISSLQHELDYTVDRFSFKEGACLAGNVSVGLPHNRAMFYRDTLTGAVCIIGGEVHNYSELKQELDEKGIALNSTSDAELILAMYTDSGESFLEAVNVWFNVLVYDLNRDKLILANDRFGFMPLYYYEGKDYFIFAPEVKAILEDKALEKKVRKKSVCEYLLFGCILNEKTFFEEICRLPPASMRIFTNNNWKMRKYWSWEECLQLPALSEHDFLSRSDEVFQKVICRYFRQSSGTVLSLTGGIDTRMIMAALPPKLYPAKTVTYGFHEDVLENVIARRISEMFGITHAFVNTEDDIISMDGIEKAVYITDGMANVFSSLAISDKFKREFKNKICIQGKFGSQVLHAAKSELKAGLNGNSWSHIKTLLSEDITKDYTPAMTLEDIRPELLNNDLAFIIEEECRHYWYGNLVLESSTGVVRTPYADYDLISLLFQCPRSLKLADVQLHFINTHNVDLAGLPTDRGVLIGKGSINSCVRALEYKIRQSLAKVCTTRYLPGFLLLNKLPFADNVVIKPWELIRNSLRAGIEEILSDRKTEKRGCFDPRKVKRIFDRHCNNIRDYSQEIGRLVALELFFRRFVDQG